MSPSSLIIVQRYYMPLTSILLATGALATAPGLSIIRVPVIDGCVNVTLTYNEMNQAHSISIPMAITAECWTFVERFSTSASLSTGIWPRISFPDDPFSGNISILEPTLSFRDGATSNLAIGPMSRIVEVLGAASVLKTDSAPSALVLGFDAPDFYSSCIEGSIFRVRLNAGQAHCGGRALLNGTMIVGEETLIRFEPLRNSVSFLAPLSFLEYVNNTLTASGSGAVRPSPNSYTFFVANCTPSTTQNLLPFDLLLYPVREQRVSGSLRFYPEDYISVENNGYCKLNFGLSDSFSIDPIAFPDTNVRITRTSIEFCESIS